MAGARTRSAGTRIAVAATKFAKAAHPKDWFSRAKPQNIHPYDDRFAETNHADTDWREADVAEFSLAKNRVIGFLVGLTAGVVVAWFAIALIAPPRLVTSPDVAIKDGGRPASQQSRSTSLSKDVWGKATGTPLDKGRWQSQTADTPPNRSNLPGFAHQNLKSEAKHERPREPGGTRQATLVDGSPTQPPASGSDRPPLPPSRNSDRENTNRKLVAIKLPEPHPARAQPPLPVRVGTRPGVPYRDATRMGLGLSVQRPPPLQRPAPANSPQSQTDP